MEKEAKIVIGVGIVIVVLFGGLIFYAAKQKTPPPSTGPVSQDVIVRSDSHGTPNIPARVTISEFGDYQCPACGVAHGAVKELLKEYAGKITFVFRNFPLDSHPNGRPAAKAAEAAALQGKFWEMHDMIYEKQNEWSNSKTVSTIFIGYAQSLKLNIDQFTKDMESDKVKDVIARDTADGITAHVQATPTFFINTEPFVGVPSKEFKDILDKALSAPSEPAK
ncbi:MAG: thioredoxin domain-containing protein [bacterium]|nr:thioredoxin domain-containing protein [bacterium]